MFYSIFSHSTLFLLTLDVRTSSYIDLGDRNVNFFVTVAVSMIAKQNRQTIAQIICVNLNNIQPMNSL